MRSASPRFSAIGAKSLTVSWSGRGEVRTLTRIEWGGALLPLRGEALLAAFYLNELLVRLLARADPHDALYRCYAQALHGLRRCELHAVDSFEELLGHRLACQFEPPQCPEHRAPLQRGKFTLNQFAEQDSVAIEKQPRAVGIHLRLIECVRGGLHPWHRKPVAVE